MDNSVDIAGLDKADVLAALYNAAKAQGMGFLHYDATPMTHDEAAAILSQMRPGEMYFDYLNGRVMKVEISGDAIRAGLYDRDNGAGACAAVIGRLRSLKDVNPEESELHSLNNTFDAAQALKAHLHDKSGLNTDDGIAKFTLGLDDVADVLAPKVEEVLGSD